MRQAKKKYRQEKERKKVRKQERNKERKHFVIKLTLEFT